MTTGECGHKNQDTLGELQGAGGVPSRIIISKIGISACREREKERLTPFIVNVSGPNFIELLNGRFCA